MICRKSYFDQKYPVVGVLKEYEGAVLDSNSQFKLDIGFFGIQGGRVGFDHWMSVFVLSSHSTTLPRTGRTLY